MSTGSDSLRGSHRSARCRRRSRADGRSTPAPPPEQSSSCLQAVLPRVFSSRRLRSILAVHVALIVGAALLLPLFVALGTGLGLGLHEAAHAALLRGVPSALVVRGPRTRVLHAAIAPTRRAVVAAGGPLAVAALGVALVAGGSLTMSPAATIAGCPFAAHALALTVVGGDGRIACGL